jgi:hypothetical protein
VALVAKRTLFFNGPLDSVPSTLFDYMNGPILRPTMSLVWEDKEIMMPLSVCDWEVKCVCVHTSFCSVSFMLTHGHMLPVCLKHSDCPPLFACQLVIEDDCVSLEQFSEHLLAPLLQLASDPVANVRVLLAKTIRQSLMERGTCIHTHWHVELTNSIVSTRTTSNYDLICCVLNTNIYILHVTQ